MAREKTLNESKEIFSSIEDPIDKLHGSGKNLKTLNAEGKQPGNGHQESTDLFRILIENLPIGICIIHQDKILYENSSLKRIMGHVPIRFRKNFLKALDFIHPDDVAKVKEAYQKINDGRLQKIEEDFRICPLGKNMDNTGLLYIHCNAIRVNYLGKKMILLSLVDNTRLKTAEQLLQVKVKMSSLGQVAAGIAHEIRNPLTGINTYLYTLEDLCEGEIIEGDKIELLKQIISQFQLASDKIETVIKRVLDFSRPNPPALALIDLNQCIEEAVNLSATMLRKDGIKLEKSMDQDLPQCYADFHLIEQVVLNLINNATQAMKKSRKTKMIKIESYRKNKSIFLDFSDSGPGISKKIKDKIFDPFITTNVDGTGIGLSITQRIISDHHGTITVLGNKYGGATFRIELPIEKRILGR